MKSQYVCLMAKNIVTLQAYQKLKKSLTSFSVVSWPMPLTLTVLDIIAV